jgi:hypothetical protein
MRFMTLHAGSALDKMIVNDGMLVKIRARFFLMATLASPVKPYLKLRGRYGRKIMTIGAPHVARYKRMNRSPLKFHRRFRMTGKAKIIQVLLHQKPGPIAVYRMA